MNGEVEMWRVIHPLGIYEVSSHGRVRRKDNLAIKRPTLARSGYLVVNLYAAGIGAVRGVHSLVSEAFSGPTPAGMMIAHRDGDRLNNTHDNLCFAPLGDRFSHDPLTGRETAGRKLSAEQARQIAVRARRGEATSALSREFGVSMPMVSRIKHGKVWKAEIPPVECNSTAASESERADEASRQGS